MSIDMVEAEEDFERWGLIPCVGEVLNMSINSYITAIYYYIYIYI